MFFARPGPEAILAAQFGLAVVPGHGLGFKVQDFALRPHWRHWKSVIYSDCCNSGPVIGPS